MKLDLQDHQTVLFSDAAALRKLSRFMRDLSAQRPEGSLVASDLDRWAVAILVTAQALQVGAERLLG